MTLAVRQWFGNGSAVQKPARAAIRSMPPTTPALLPEVPGVGTLREVGPGARPWSRTLAASMNLGRGVVPVRESA